jgi:hypothetical protein
MERDPVSETSCFFLQKHRKMGKVKKKTVMLCGFSWLRTEAVGCCEQDSIKMLKFVESLGNCWLLKKYPASMS